VVSSAAGDEAASAPIAAGNKDTILLVEDEGEIMAIAREFLKDLGYRVLEASNGSQALAIVGSDEPVDLLFTDVVLPDGMNGAEVARAATTLRPGLKVLFATGYTREALTQQGRLGPGINLLQKPYRKSDLARAVRALL
jgi:CheY-like chemotaxis protein